MPNIRRTFPTREKLSSSDDDDDDDDEEEQQQQQQQQPPQYRMGQGKQLRPMGGKQLGGGVAYGQDDEEEDDEDDDDDDDDSEEEEEPQQQQQQYGNRGSGKQLLRPPGGNYMPPRPQDDDDDDDEDSDELEDDDEEAQQEQQPAVAVQRVQHRGGGKNLIRYRQAQEEEEESEESEEEPVVVAPVRVMARSGGKSLSRPPAESEDEDDEEEDDAMDVEQDEEPAKPPQRPAVYGSPAGGKQLRRPDPEEDEEEAPKTTISRTTPGRGKQLRRPEPEDEAPPPAKSTISRAAPAGRGKQLRRPEPEEEEEPAKTSISRSPAGGKQLRRPDPEEEEENEPAKTSISRSPAGGKQLRRSEPEEEKPKPKKAISRSPAGGKQLRRPTAKDDDDDDDSDEDDDVELDSDGAEDDDDAYEESFVPKPKGRPSRAAKKKQVESSEDEDFLDDDVSSDEEQELDINNTEALIQNEDDRKYLDTLPELEREAILGERFEKLKEKQDMKKAIREAKRKETEKAAKAKPPAKRKAAGSKGSSKKSKTDKDAAIAKALASKRESSRDRDAKGAKSKKAAALAALRKERKVQQEKMDESEESESDFGDDDEDSDDEYQEAMPWQKKGKAAKSTVSRLDQADDSDDDMEIDDDDQPVKKRGSRVSTDRTSTISKDADLEDIKKVVIPRRRLARWCAEPFFDAAILECFVRLFIGEDDNGEKVYRICEIIDVKTGAKTYKFPVTNRNDKPISTNKVLQLKFGKHERDFPMYLVSDEAPKEKDVRQYISVQKNLRAEVLSKRRAIKLRRLQDDLVNNYRYTKEDIERNLEHRKQEGTSRANLGSEQTRVAILVQAARDTIKESERALADAKRISLEFSGDSNQELELSNNVRDAEKALKDAHASLEKRLEEERNTLSAVEERKKRLAGQEKNVNWAKVNERNLKANQRADREALMMEEAATPGKKTEFNPYARRKVKPKILWQVGQTEAEDGKSAATGEEKKDSGEEAPADSTAVEDAPGLIPEGAVKDAGLSESHQFAIDEEVLAGRGAGNRNGVRKQRVRKGLSLAEYQERKASGTL